MRLEQWLYAIPLRLRSLLRRGRVEQELDDEFQFHLEQRIEANIARGLTPAAARAEAIRALDNVALRKEECRDMRGLNPIDNLSQDLRYALRALRKSPVFTAVAILSLALGIGANTAIFSVMDVLLLRPLAVPYPERLELLGLSGKEHPQYSSNYPLFELVRDRSQFFSHTFAWSNENYQTPVGADMVHIPVTPASGDYFSGLGVSPALGRVFGREDDRVSGANPVAVISDGFWSRRFGRDRGVLGRKIIVNAVPLTIIGVMPPGFFGAEVGLAPDLWLPLNLERRLGGVQCIASADCWFLYTMGRLKPGVSEAEARAQLEAVSHGILEDDDPPKRADRRADFLARRLQLEPGSAGFTGLRLRVRRPVEVLMALVAFVLLIACANMANLLTARASARQRDVAIRLAIGAGRWRIVRQFLAESLLLAVGGAAGGFVIAIWATRILIALVSSKAVLDLRPDWRVLLFTALAALATGLLFGIGPALRATRAGIGPALKERGQQIQSAQNRFGMMRVLLGTQVALSVVLLAAAGLLAGSLARLLNESPGFDPRGVTLVDLDTSQLPLKPPALADLYGAILQRAQRLPGVKSASLISNAPLSNSGWDNYVEIPGRTDLPEEQRDADLNAVGPGLLRTMRIPLIAGREFTDDDTAQSLHVAIISENAAHRWFPQGALGREITLNRIAVRIVGVAGNSKYWAPRDAMPTTMFVPYTQWGQFRYVALRTDAPLRQTYAEFRDILRQAAPGTPIRGIKTMTQVVDESLSTERLTAYLSLFFAGLALLLTAVGLYGILTYSVSQRTGEIGIRMALGARRGSVLWLVVREAMGNVAIGAIAGLAAAVASAKLIASLLYGVKPNDSATLAAAVVTLAAVAMAAAWIPARRASRMDPMRALREE